MRSIIAQTAWAALGRGATAQRLACPRLPSPLSGPPPGPALGRLGSMAPALSESSSDDGAPPDLVSSFSDGGDRWPASGLIPPGTNIPVATDVSDEEEPADLPPGTGTAVDPCGATSPTTGTARRARARAQLSALKGAARELGRQHAAAQVAAARSATEERRGNRSQRQEGVASDPIDLVNDHEADTDDAKAARARAARRLLRRAHEGDFIQSPPFVDGNTASGSKRQGGVAHSTAEAERSRSSTGCTPRPSRWSSACSASAGPGTRGELGRGAEGVAGAARQAM